MEKPSGESPSYTYHKPVMLKECIQALSISPTGTYADVTFGGGGHSEIIAQMLPEGRLFAFDQDPDAALNAAQWKHPGFHFFQANFRYLERYLDSYDAVPLDGILADLGISSWQIDEPGKGFSIRFDGPLDMRMNPTADLSAKEIVNDYAAEELTRIFKDLAELPNAYRVAQHLVAARARQRIETTLQLREALWPIAPRHAEFKFLAQVFQGIRIEVNDELTALKEMLQQASNVLRPGGKLVVLTYHSLEDRLVKDFMASGNFTGKAEKDLYGHVLNVPLEPVSKKPLLPTDAEIAENPRARSAKLRVAERVVERMGTSFPI